MLGSIALRLVVCVVALVVVALVKLYNSWGR